MSRARVILAAAGAILAAISACTIIDKPTQCENDGDCFRFDARCDVVAAVCVPRSDDKTTRSAPLPATSVETTTSPTVPVTAANVTAAEPSDAGAPASDSGIAALVATITCGATPCPVGPDSVCCVADGVPKCTKRADCTGGYARCDETSDCTALGFDGGTVCCGFNDGAGQPALTRARCVPSAQCDPSGPQDQLCKVDGPADQCAIAGNGLTKCAPFAYSNTSDYAFCVAP